MISQVTLAKVPSFGVSPWGEAVSDEEIIISKLDSVMSKQNAQGKMLEAILQNMASMNKAMLKVNKKEGGEADGGSFISHFCERFRN